MTRTVELYADDGGTGSLLPVVFLHSTAGNASQWSAQLEHLRPRRAAVALEWRGHGRSGPPADGDYSFPAMAADVDEAVDRHREVRARRAQWRWTRGPGVRR